MRSIIEYPNPNDTNFLSTIFKKREFPRQQVRPQMKNYNIIKNYRDKVCASTTQHLLPHQIFLSNYINPKTPYKGLLIFHGTGTGKCVLPDVYININNDISRIEDIWDKYKSVIDPDDIGEWSCPSEELQVDSYDISKHVFIKKKVLKLYRQSIDENIRSIVLVNGLNIEITEAHHLLTEDGWTNELKKGMKICIPKNTKVKNSKFFNNANELIKKFTQHLSVNNSENDLFEIPKDLILLDEKDLKTLINSIFTSEGVFAVETKEVKIASKSRKFLFQLQYLLTKFGVTLKIADFIRDNKTYYIGNLNEEETTQYIDTFFAGNSSKESESIFVEIESIESKKYKGYVYDLEVKDTHNYTANNIVCHNTCTSISIGETFKKQVKKYGTKIFILVPGPAIRKIFEDELIGWCTGNSYMDQKSVVTDPQLFKRRRKLALKEVSKYYQIMTEKSFLRKVLGEKIRSSYRKYIKNKRGKYKRDVAPNPITHLSNTLIIVDEAHRYVNNEYGKSLQQIINSSKSINLKVVLLTATPMSNTANHIVFLMNILRPKSSPIIENKVFDHDRATGKLTIKKDGIVYFKKMIKGYVSYLRGADPLTYATREDQGKIPRKIKFTKVNECEMDYFQRESYFKLAPKDSKQKIPFETSRNLEAISNIVFPMYKRSEEKIIGYYGNEGMRQVENFLRNLRDSMRFTKALQKKFPRLKIDSNFIHLNKNDEITGSFLRIENLRLFSTKFYLALKNINKNVIKQNGPGTSFVYARRTKSGVNIFKEVLKQNGYINYDKRNENKDNMNVICYLCGIKRSKHNKQTHNFHPAAFMAITGEKMDKDNFDKERESLKREEYLDAFNHENNADGKHIKILIGSSVMTEGTSLKRVKDVHVLEAYYTLTSVDQIIGRAIRYCKHYDLMNDSNKFPIVKVFKYVATLKNIMSHELMKYFSAEYKYKIIKEIERVMKEMAVDCPFNISSNIFPEEVNKYKGCLKKGNCPVACDFKECEYKCDDSVLNSKYYIKSEKDYKRLNLDEMDSSTFSDILTKHEILFAKEKIKEMYRVKFVYTLDQIVNYVQSRYPSYKKSMFDISFIYKALDNLIPKTEHDFNNFKDIVYDKYNRKGYLIYRNMYYIYQQFGESEDVSMSNRRNYKRINLATQTLEKYLKTKGFKTNTTTSVSGERIRKTYDFSSTKKYYDNRSEYDVVGIIAQEPNRKRSKKRDELKEVFNIRSRIDKTIKKKRKKGLPSTLGADCLSKSKGDLKRIARKLHIEINKKDKRKILCKKIKAKLLILEKYAKGKNKITYIKVPKNHPKYPFPYNLEDRYNYILDEVNIYFKSSSVTMTVKKEKERIVLKITNMNPKDLEFLESLGGITTKEETIFEVK
jgi:hypothetical protein